MVEKKLEDIETDLAVEVDGRPWTKELAYLSKRPSYPAVSGGLLGQREPNIPTPYPAIRMWVPGANIATMLSVIQTGAGVEGPSRTMLPLRTQTTPDQLRGQMIRSAADVKPLSDRERLTFSGPAMSSEASWRPGYRVDEDPIVIDEGEVEMLRRRKQVGPLAPPIAAQAVITTQAAPPAFAGQNVFTIRRNLRRMLGLEE
jgi:hypothetical protein